jgi:hypothetical protein
VEENKHKSLDLGFIYKEILQGFSEKNVNKKHFYLKHPTLSEHFTVYSRYNYLLKEARLKGLATEEEKIKEAISNDWWKEENEKEIYILRQGIKNLKKTKTQLLIPSQRRDIDNMIKSKEAILLTFVRERQSVLNYTAEEYANNRFSDEMIIYFTYSNKNLNLNLFNNVDEYYEASDEFIEELKSIYNLHTQDLNEKNLKIVAASGFFQNMLYLGDQAQTFWGKPVTACSKYQTDLLMYGKMFKNIIKNNAENGVSMSEEVLNDPWLFVEWVENENKGKSKDIGKKNLSKNAVSSYVGVDETELKKMGVKVEKIKGKSLLQLAEEKGGMLEKNDYFKLREN